MKRLRHWFAGALQLIREFMETLMLDIPDDIDDGSRAFCRDILDKE